MEAGIAWNDPLININWDEIFTKYGIDRKDIVLSDKDKARPMLEEEPKYFEYKRLELKNVIEKNS